MSAPTSAQGPIAVALEALKAPLPFSLVQLSEQRMRGVDAFLMAWCAECGLGDERAREVVRVYIEYCSSADADDTSVELAAEFLMWFFALNDISDGPEKREVLIEVLSILRGADVGSSPLVPATRRFRDRIAALGSHTHRLHAALEAMFASFFWEIEHVGQTPPAPAYQKNREHTVAVYPYMAIFRHGLGLPSDDERWPDLAALEQLSVEIIYLVNDILSVARDHRKNKQNFVFSVAADRGVSRDDAVPLAVSHLFDRIDAFRGRSEAFLASAAADAPVRAYLAFLASYLEGTRVATLVLRDRYFGRG